jgi:hypothetical protein
LAFPTRRARVVCFAAGPGHECGPLGRFSTLRFGALVEGLISDYVRNVLTFVIVNGLSPSRRIKTR